jgi:ABC-type multidrug transport system fused ATPase/permease subunit
MVAPLLFGRVVDAAQTSMGEFIFIESDMQVIVNPRIFLLILQERPFEMFRFLISFSAELNKNVLILLGVYAGGTVASMCRSWTFTIAGQRVVASLRCHLFAKIIIQDIAFFDVTRYSESKLN